MKYWSVLSLLFFDTEIFDLKSWQKMGENFINIVSTQDENRAFQSELKRMASNYERHRKEHLASKRTILETWDILSLQYPVMTKIDLILQLL